MNTTLLFIMGKISQFISQFFRYILIVILLAILGVGTVGIGTLIGVIFLKFIQKMIPFKISIYSDFLELLQKKISIEIFRNQFRKKLIYNIILFSIILFSVNIIRDDWATFNTKDKILFSVFSGVLISPLLFQFYYFYIVNNFVKINNGRFSQNFLSTNENDRTLDNFENKVENNTSKHFNLSIKKRLNWRNSLNHNEIIIVSVIIGVIIFLLLGYGFGERKYKTYGYTKYYYKTEFNYILGFTSFIITTGISYLFLNSKNKNKK